MQNYKLLQHSANLDHFINQRLYSILNDETFASLDESLKLDFLHVRNDLYAVLWGNLFNFGRSQVFEQVST